MASVQFFRGMWHARVTQKDGSRPWVPLPGVADRDDAKRIGDELQRDVDAGKFVAPRPKRGSRARVVQHESVAIWFERWQQWRESKGIAAVRTDRSRFKRHIGPAIGHLAMADVCRRDLELFVAELDAKVASDKMEPPTAKRIWSVARKMFVDAQRSKQLGLRVREDNPARDVAGPDTGPKKSKQFLYPSEFLALVSCDAIPVNERRLYAIAAYTWLRSNELDALQWSDLDIPHRVMTVHRAVDRRTGEEHEVKGGKGTRDIPIHDAIAPMLQAMKDEGCDRPVPDIPGGHALAAEEFRQRLLAAGVTRPALHTTTKTRKRITFHDLRATGITWTALQGMDPLRIMQRAGHRKFETTMGYIRTAEMLRSADVGEPFPPLPDKLSARQETENGSASDALDARKIAQSAQSTVPTAARNAAKARRNRWDDPRRDACQTLPDGGQTDGSTVPLAPSIARAVVRERGVGATTRRVVRLARECLALAHGATETAPARQEATVIRLAAIARLKGK